MRSSAGSIKTWVMIFVVLAGGGIALLVGIGCAIHANACPFRSTPAQTSTDGMTLFLTNCSACHGRRGEGGRGPVLAAGDAALLTHAQLVSKISDGKPLAGMPKFDAVLSARQIDAVARFVESLQGKGSP